MVVHVTVSVEQTTILEKNVVTDWFNDFIIVVGGEKKACVFDEVAAFIWAAFLCWLERSRSKGAIKFHGSALDICNLETMKLMMQEYEISSLAKSTPSLNGIKDFLHGQLNGLLKHRGVS